MNAERQIITDSLVVEKTGQTMEHWFAMLDAKGAKKLTHIDIFALLGSFSGIEHLGEWNQNLLTTTYEWSRKLKERNQKGDGNFEIGVSKTVNCPIDILFRSLVDDTFRIRWLPENIHFRKTTLNKSARITWTDEKTSLSVDFYMKGNDKSQIVVQHLKLPDADSATEMKAFWNVRLSTLKDLLEKEAE